MKASDLRPGMKIVHSRNPITKKPIRVTEVKSAWPCTAHIRGVGRTHINETDCYDNATELDVM